jgi:hypothetical protein
MTLKRRAFVNAIILIFSAISSLAQPSPDFQRRISHAIAAAANESYPDYTAFVNPFIGTGMCCGIRPPRFSEYPSRRFLGCVVN